MVSWRNTGTRAIPKAIWLQPMFLQRRSVSVSYTHLRAHETVLDLVCRLLLEKTKNTKKKKKQPTQKKQIRIKK